MQQDLKTITAKQAARAKFDPAVVASPALTTIVDIIGLLIYFITSKLVLGAIDGADSQPTIKHLDIN